MPNLNASLNPSLKKIAGNVKKMLSQKGWHECLDGSLEFKDTGISVRESGYNEIAIIYSWDEGRITYEGNVINEIGDE